MLDSRCLQVYFNKYALVYVAVYGTPFMQSAKNMGRMLSTRGFSESLNIPFALLICVMTVVADCILICENKQTNKKIAAAVLNDDITGMVLTFVCVLNSLIVSTLAMIIASWSGNSLSATKFTAALWVSTKIASRK
jgi:hypothetical protein